MGKGAKDTTALGDLLMETISNDIYSRLFLQNFEIGQGLRK